MKRRSGFTLVELLIVMGILAILMTIGIAVGRFAIQRANNIQHESAATQLGQAIQSYYTDNRRYPTDIVGADTITTGVLAEYIDGSFDGGAAATFYYATNETQQAYLVCVTYGGTEDADELGMYCHGDGYEDPDIFSGVVSEQKLDFCESGCEYASLIANIASADSTANWDGDAWE